MSMLSAIGVMGGTSYDGVDVALINTDGEDDRPPRPDRLSRLWRSRRALALRRAIAATPISPTAVTDRTRSWRRRNRC